MSSSFTQPEPPTARSSRRSRSASSSIARLSGSSTPKLNPTDNDIEILLLVEVDVSGSPNKARAKKPSNSKVNTPSRYSLQTSSDKDGRDILSMLNGQARRSNDSSPNKEPTSNMKKRKLPSTPALPSQPSRKSSRLSEKTVDFSNNGLQLKKSPHIIETPSRKTRLKGLGTLQSGGVKSFEEPELAAPQPIYTGLPLESFPTAKIKKESLWPLNKKINGNGLNKKSRSTSYNNSRNSSVTPPDDISSIDGVEQDYKLNLTTSKSEDISSVSEIREPRLPKKKPGKKTEGLKLIIRTPKKIKSNQTSSKATATTSNKVKVISPKKPNNTNLAPINRNVNEQDTHSEGDPAEENEDFSEDQRESMDDSNVDIHPNFKLPAYFDSTTNSDDKVVAKASNNLSKLLVITDKSQDTGVTNKGFVYRVPEESIILSFMAKSKELRNTNPETVRTKKATIMEEISNYENRSRLESNSDELELVDGLSQLKQRPIVHHPSNKIDFDELVKIALESEGLTPYTENKDVKSSISLEEIDDLLKIKKLIEAKGRESLIDFLKELRS
ncbi:hypothetical protein QCA50_018866 [Cerrena zonata]|uniref:Uncharacterized protein n=1 Tax=Cerrena zonata TaxID=2478898 RepID=A0AAW0FDL2_9APHY